MPSCTTVLPVAVVAPHVKTSMYPMECRPLARDALKTDELTHPEELDVNETLPGQLPGVTNVPSGLNSVWVLQ